MEARGEGGGEGNIKEKGKYERRRGERREREGKEGEEKREKPHSKNILDEYWNELLYILYMMSVLNYTVYVLWTSLNIIRIMSYSFLKALKIR